MKKFLYSILFIIEMVLTPIYFVVFMAWFTCICIRDRVNVIAGLIQGSRMCKGYFINGLKTYKKIILGV